MGDSIRVPMLSKPEVLIEVIRKAAAIAGKYEGEMRSGIATRRLIAA